MRVAPAIANLVFQGRKAPSSQAVLFRGVDLAIVWPLLAAIGTVYFAFALGRFRRVIFGT